MPQIRGFTSKQSYEYQDFIHHKNCYIIAFKGTDDHDFLRMPNAIFHSCIMLSDHIRTFQPSTKTDYKKKLLYSINKFDYISSIFAESDSGAQNFRDMSRTNTYCKTSARFRAACHRFGAVRPTSIYAQPMKRMHRTDKQTEK